LTDHTIVIKSGLTRWINSRPGGWTSPSLPKEWSVQRPNQTRSTHDPGKPGFTWSLTFFKAHYINIRKNILFFQCVIWNPLLYILYISKKKGYVFLMWDLKPFSIYTLCFQEKNYFLNVRFKVLSYIYSMFTRKKLCFFNVR